jgi:hypothetical protein
MELLDASSQQAKSLPPSIYVIDDDGVGVMVGRFPTKTRRCNGLSARHRSELLQRVTNDQDGEMLPTFRVVLSSSHRPTKVSGNRPLEQLLVG